MRICKTCQERFGALPEFNGCDLALWMHCHCDDTVPQAEAGKPCYICGHVEKDFSAKVVYRLTYELFDKDLMTTGIIATGPCQYCPRCGREIK